MSNGPRSIREAYDTSLYSFEGDQLAESL